MEVAKAELQTRSEMRRQQPMAPLGTQLGNSTVTNTIERTKVSSRFLAYKSTPRETLPPPSTESWLPTIRNRTVHPKLTCTNKSVDACNDALNVIRNIGARWVVDTDGSALRDQRRRICDGSDSWRHIRSI